MTSSVQQVRSPDAARGRAVWLSLSPDPVLGFLHGPETSARRPVAVLICPPFGWEEMCSSRGRRAWAQALARAGYPTARIDLPGSGDSGGSPSDPERLDAWTGAASAAASWLRETTACERVVAIGVGLGGMVAYRAAAEGAEIDDLVLWGVPAHGHTLLREMRARAAIIAALHPANAQTPPQAAEGGLELTGFLMSAETARELDELQLTALPLPDAATRRVLLLERDRLGVDKRLREHCEQAGAVVTVAPTGDYGELMALPHEARTPARTIATTLAWLGGDAEQSSPHATPLPTLRPEPRAMRLGKIGEPILETPLDFEVGDRQLFGVLCEPADRERAPVCAVLLNAGALSHIGPNRTWVDIARRWAARGVPTLRVDLEGIGESDGNERQLLSNAKLYDPHRTADTLAVLDQLGARGLPTRFVLAGLCSGAYWALHAALADERIAGALMINLYALFWSEELVAEHETQETLAGLRGSGWQRLAKREVSAADIRSAVRSMRPSRIRDGARRPVERSQSDQVDRALDRLRDQGTDALLLLSEGEPLYGRLARQGQLDRLESWPNLTVERIPSTDHLFRASRLQQHVHESLDAALDRVLEGETNTKPAQLRGRAA